MAAIGIGIPYPLDQILDALQEVALCFTVIEPDGTVHNRLPETEGCTRVEAPEGNVCEVVGGDQLMHRFQTLAEARAFLSGILMGFTASDAHMVQAEALELTEADPYRRSAELHKLGWCPIWDDWEYHSQLYTNRQRNAE